MKNQAVNLDYRILDAGEFVRVDASGRIDLAASLRMAEAIAGFDGSAATLPVLLDVRAVSGQLSTLDIVDLVRALLADRARYSRPLAVLTRHGDQLARARFFENYADNRGVPVAAFDDPDAALAWLRRPSAG